MGNPGAPRQSDHSPLGALKGPAWPKRGSLPGMNCHSRETSFFFLFRSEYENQS